jgi:hypothetical protein
MECVLALDILKRYEVMGIFIAHNVVVVAKSPVKVPQTT